MYRKLDRKRVRLAIEARNLSEDAPLVIYCIPRTQGEAHHDFAGYSPVLSRHRIVNVTGSQSLYEPFALVGKSPVRVIPKDNPKTGVKFEIGPVTEVYDRWAQALASCVELAQAAWVEGGSDWSFIMPMVVVPDAALWRIVYDEETGLMKEAPLKVDECEFLVDYPIPMDGKKMTLSHLHFLTMKGLSNLLNRFLTDHAIWGKMFPDVTIRP